MSKIQETLDGIRACLSGSDRSNSPHLRKLAETYCSACVTVNAALAECRRLIDRGLWSDAVARNNAVSPAFSARAQMLNLPEKAQFDELCRLYHYGVAPDPDMETAELLDNPPETRLVFNRLILQWRKIAREGSAADKVLLLRRIIAALPDADAALWRNNLSRAEPAYLQELLREANQCRKAGKFQRLQEICRSLTEPGWITPVPPETLAEISQPLHQHQQEEFRHRIREHLRRLAEAYSALDFDRLRELLTAWQSLRTHPLFQASPEELRQVDEAEKVLAEREQEVERQRTGKEQIRKLTAELNRHGDFDAIENLYAALRQSDFPIPASLAARVAQRRDEAHSEERRRHIRRCVYVILLTVLILCGGAAAILYRQHLRTRQQYRDSMIAELKANNYDTVLALCRQVELENPMLARQGAFVDLKMEAERKKIQFEADEQQFSRILEEAAALRSAAPAPDLAAVQARLDELDKLHPDERSAALREKYRLLRERQQKALRKRQQQTDDEFLTKVRTLGAAAEELRQNFKQGKLPEAPEAHLAELRRRAAVLRSHPGSVSPALVGEQLDLLQLQIDSAAQAFEQFRKQIALRQTLTAAPDFPSYCKALNELPIQAPDMAAGPWRTALKLLPLYQAAAQSAALGLPTDPQTFHNQSSAIALPGRAMPFLNDIERLLQQPENGSAAILDTMRSRLLPDYLCLELAFQCAPDRVYRFYTAEQPQKERRNRSRQLKTLAMQLKNSASEQKQNVLFEVVPPRQAGLNHIYKVSAPAELKLPGELPEPYNLIQHSGELPTSMHGEFLARMLAALDAASTPSTREQEVLHELSLLKETAQMNPYARVEIAVQLFALLRDLSPFYDIAVSAQQQELLAFQHARAIHWDNPAEAALHPDEVAYADRFFTALDPDALRQYHQFCSELHSRLLGLGVEPAGIVLSDQPGKARVSLFGFASEAAEIQLLMPDPSGTEIASILAVRRSELGPHGEIPARYAENLQTGMVVFAPPNKRTTEELLQGLAAQGLPAEPLWPDSWPVNRRNLQP